MGKLKQTKIKHRKHKHKVPNENESHENQNTHTNKKYKILTSKNKNKLVLKEGRYYRKNVSINKKHKRSKKKLNIRTLDALKTYGSILKNQDGGFIISYLKFKWNMRKIKKIIDKLGKNQKELNEFIDSYKKQPETFKRLGDKKAVVIYDILRTEKEKTIIEFLLQNKDKEKTYDTSNMQHDLDMINTKITIATKEQLKQLNKEIEKEKPIYEKNKKKFEKDSKKYEKINEDYSKLMAFYEEQKELSDRYNAIKDLEKLTKEDKSIKTKYLKNEENIKYILSYKQEDISAINKNIKELATLMNMSHDYDEKFKDLTQSKYETDLQKWQGNYKDIYVNITDIEGGIKHVSDTLDKIKEYADQIGSNLSSIYAAIKQSFKLDPILKIKRIIDENLGYLKNVKDVSLKKVKYAFIEQIPIEQIEFYLPLASAALIQTEKSMNELNTSFILDSSFIRTGHAGGGGISGMGMGMGMGMGIGELEWFGKGGVKTLSYDELSKLTIEKFLDTECDIIIDTLKKMNSDLITGTIMTVKSDIFKLKNTQFLDIMKIYFNIYIFFLYYNKARTHDDTHKSVDIDFTTDGDNDKIILFFLSIIKQYIHINTEYSNDTYHELPETTKTDILNIFNKILTFFDNTGGPFITTLNNNINTDYFNIINTTDNKIYNPFNIDKNKKLIKNLYYEYNPHDFTITNNLGCIKVFFGHYDKKQVGPTTKELCDVTENTFFTSGALHNKYDNIPIIYKKKTNDTYFVTIYYDKDIIKTTKIEKCDNFDAIALYHTNLKTKFNNPEHMIDTTHAPLYTSKTYEDDINNVNDNINDTDLDTLFYNTTFNHDNLNNIIHPNVITDEYKTFYINYIKYILTNDWDVEFLIGENMFNIFHTIQNHNNTFTDFKDFIKQTNHRKTFINNIYKYLLVSVYNKIPFPGALYDNTTSTTDITDNGITYKPIIFAKMIEIEYVALDILYRAKLFSDNLNSNKNTMVTKQQHFQDLIKSLNKILTLCQINQKVGPVTREIILLLTSIIPNMIVLDDNHNITTKPTSQNTNKIINLCETLLEFMKHQNISKSNTIINTIIPSLIEYPLGTNIDKAGAIANVVIALNDVAAAGPVDTTIANVKRTSLDISRAPAVAAAGAPQAAIVLANVAVATLPAPLVGWFGVAGAGSTNVMVLISSIIVALNKIETEPAGPIQTSYPFFNSMDSDELKAHLNKLAKISTTVNKVITQRTYPDFTLPNVPCDNLLHVLKCKDKKFIVLYKYLTEVDVENKIKDNEIMIKYLFTWLKSEANDEANKELKVDNVSKFIDKLYDNTSKKNIPLSNLDIDKIEENEFYKALEINEPDQSIFKNSYDNQLAGTTPSKSSLIKKEDINVYTSSIADRLENRLFFDLPQAKKINTDEPIKTVSNKFITTIQPDIITKNDNKTADNKHISSKYIKRIVLFNVNNWYRSVNDLKNIKPTPLSPTLFSDPKNAIDFINKYLPNTDVLGFLDYTLYAETEIKAKKHTQDKKNTTIINKENKVNNTYVENIINTDLKLNKFITKNDNFDNAISKKRIYIDNNNNMFLGKAIYYNDTTPITNYKNLANPLTNVNTILYSEVKIHAKPIGLYLVNVYSPIDNTEIDNFLQNINDNKTDTNIEDIIIMGNFTFIDIATQTKFYKDISNDGYTQIGSRTHPDTCIYNDYKDLCFVSNNFQDKNKFTILNQNNIVVPSGSVSTHYPIYLDIIENDDKEINESNVRTIEKDGTVIIRIPNAKLTFILKPKPKAKSTPMPGGSKSIDLTSDYILEKFSKDGATLIDISKDPVFKSYKIEIEDKKIIKILNEEGKLKYSINEEGILTTFKNDGSSIELITMKDPKNDNLFINTDTDGKEISRSEIGDGGKVITKDISTGDVVKSYYEDEDDELKEAKKKGERLLSTFMDDINKEHISTMVSKNKESIIGYIKKISDLIQTKLKPKNYEAIKLKLDALAKNIIELKAIEPELTPDKVLIKEYAQKARSYDWMEDVTKREKVSLSLQDEAKELEAILKTHPEIKDILPSATESLTRENILDIISSLDLSKNTIINKTFLEKFQNKLKQTENAKILLNYLDETYKTSLDMYKKCVILNKVISYAPLTLYGDKINFHDCHEEIKKKYAEKLDKSKGK